MSRHHAVALLTLAFVWHLSSTASAQRPQHSWPQWQGPSRDGQTSETGLLKSWPEGGPHRRWLFENCGAGYGGPAIVAGRLYIMGARGGQCFLICLDAATGEPLWETPMGDALRNDWGDGPRGTPAVADGRVYAMSGAGTIICVQASDGREVWRTTMRELGGQMPFWGYSESLLVDGDRVLCTPGGERGTIAALDKSTGQVLWQANELTDGAHYSSIIPAEFHGQRQYVQLLEKRLVGLAAEDGRLLWQVPFPGSVAVIPTPVAHDGRVFATAGYGAGSMLVDIASDNSATTIYENKLLKNHHGGVVRVGDYVYGHSDGTGWRCMNFLTGEDAWLERRSLGKGAIAYANGMLYCLGEDDGEVVLIEASPQGWHEQGRFTLAPQSQIRSDQGKIWTHPVVVDGKLFLRDQDLVYCYDVKAVVP